MRPVISFYSAPWRSLGKIMGRACTMFLRRIFGAYNGKIAAATTKDIWEWLQHVRTVIGKRKCIVAEYDMEEQFTNTDKTDVFTVFDWAAKIVQEESRNIQFLYTSPTGKEILQGQHLQLSSMSCSYGNYENTLRLRLMKIQCLRWDII